MLGFSIAVCGDPGVGRWRRFVDVILPLAAPGIFAGSVFIFVNGLGMALLPNIMGGAGAVNPGLIATQAITALDFPLAMAVSAIMMATLMTFLWIGQKLFDPTRILTPLSRRVEAPEEAGVPAGPIYRMDEVFADPQVRHLRMVAPAHHPARGETKLFAQPVTLSRTPASVYVLAPDAGEHTDAVLAEAGLGADEIAALREKKIICGGELVNSYDSDAVSMPVEPVWQDIREAVARLCADFPNAYWMKLDAEDAYPSDFVAALTESGFLGALIPEEYGGSGLPLSAAGAVLETIHAEGCNAAACHAQMYTMGTVLRHGSAEQKQKYLPRIASGELRLQAFGVTEPTTGSDTTQLKTKAEKTDRGTYIVNGQKVWTSRAFESDLMLLLARTTPADRCKKRSDGMSVFLIDMNEARKTGLSLSRIDAMINHNTCEVFFDNLEIPADTLIGEEGKGFRYIVDSMNAERVLIAYECIGDARFFLRKATEYANERVVFGRPIGANQGIQFPIAQAYAQAQAAELMVTKAATLFDSGQNAGASANMAKLLAADASWQAAEVCMQVFGGFAFAREYGIERKWREARLYQTAPISKNMIFAYLGQHVLGLPRSY